MTFPEARLSLQLLADELIGAPRRRVAAELKQQEDAAWAAATRRPHVR